ncbi:MAG: hypothetical protein BroJett030_32400 [Alphaproteobacteria bacterium]|nr:MAG: hypothetical protein BroJett030_32400 [Alphaproteobacteria bacterium]
MDRLAAWVAFIARWMALAGGFVLVVLTVLTVVSISGRAILTMANLHDPQSWLTAFYAVLRAIGGFFNGLGARPIPGDYELVEAGTAFAIFAFLPWCHLNRGHAAVDVLASWFPGLMNRVIDVIANLLMLAVALLIAWRHWLGTLDKISYGETTFILQFPVWWGYAAGMVGAVVFIVVAAFCLARSIADFASGHRAERSGAAP